MRGRGGEDRRFRVNCTHDSRASYVRNVARLRRRNDDEEGKKNQDWSKTSKNKEKEKEGEERIPPETGNA